jgi:hypothetical protein
VSWCTLVIVDKDYRKGFLLIIVGLCLLVGEANNISSNHQGKAKAVIVIRRI